MVRKFSQLSAQFLKWANKVLRPSTVAVYKHYLRCFIEHHGDLLVEDVRPAHLIEFGDTWHKCQAVKRLFVWASADAGLIPSNPLARVKHPPKGHRRRILTPVESARFLRSARRDLRELVIAYRETYARPQELRLACWDDIHGDETKLTTRQALEQCRASIVLFEFKGRRRREDSEKPRVIILSPRACRLLLRLFKRQHHRRGRIFKTDRGRAWTANALRCRFRRLRAKLRLRRDKRGENVVPYTFRHTGATLAAAAGVRDRLLADILGHVETKTTARYQHLQLHHLRDAMKRLWKL